MTFEALQLSEKTLIMHDAAIETVVAFLRTYGLSCSSWGEKDHRTRGITCKVESVEYLLVFEQGELPELNVHYVGNERQFINEKFTSVSFPDVHSLLQEAMRRLGSTKSRRRHDQLANGVIEEFSLPLAKRYCEVLLRRIQNG